MNTDIFDPVVELYREWRAVHARLERVLRRSDDMLFVVMDRLGLDMPWPHLRLTMPHSEQGAVVSRPASPEEIAACVEDAPTRTRLTEELATLRHRWDAAYEAVGLPALHEEERRLSAAEDALSKAVLTTEPTTPAGIAALLEISLAHGGPTPATEADEPWPFILAALRAAKTMWPNRL